MESINKELDWKINDLFTVIHRDPFSGTSPFFRLTPHPYPGIPITFSHLEGKK